MKSSTNSVTRKADVLSVMKESMKKTTTWLLQRVTATKNVFLNTAKNPLQPKSQKIYIQAEMEGVVSLPLKNQLQNLVGGCLGEGASQLNISFHHIFSAGKNKFNEKFSHNNYSIWQTKKKHPKHVNM